MEKKNEKKSANCLSTAKISICMFEMKIQKMKNMHQKLYEQNVPQVGLLSRSLGF